MHQMQTIVTDRRVCPSVCQSCDSTQIHCAKMSEQIKILFKVNNLGGPRNIVLDPPQRKGGGAGENFANSGPTTYQDGVLIDYRGLTALTKTMQKYVIGGSGSRDLLSMFVTLSYLLTD